MTQRFQITIDCNDPDVMTRFWAEALPDYSLQPPPQGHDTWREYWLSVGVPEEELGEGTDRLESSTGGPQIWFQHVPETKSMKNRMHFDLLVGGGRVVPISERRERVRAEAERLEAFGASVVLESDTPEFDHFFIAMRDPEGNEFDVV
jgi:hypothetical protein